MKKTKSKTIVIIGGGAAGFFAAMAAAQKSPQHQVIILEKSNKLLSKVKISGGGRCNVTHNCPNPFELAKNYPRGEKALKIAFQKFAVNDTIHWFEQRGVQLKTEADGRIFPTSNDSQTIIDCFLEEAQRLHIDIRLHSEVHQIIPQKNGDFVLKIKKQTDIQADKIIITTGGSPKMEGLQWLADLGHRIEPPVPSLFTLNIPQNPIATLMGVAVPLANIKVQQSRLKQEGAVLITHWGLSGPAILRLSAWGARTLQGLGYQYPIQINWLNQTKEDELREMLLATKAQFPQKKIINHPLGLPKRLSEFLIQKAQINPDKVWQEISKTDINRLSAILTADVYQVNGKTTFKEEFVTCGGISLSDVDFDTMQSKVIPNLYFAGELLDIDGITGGFNFQAAWTTGFIAGNSAAD